MDHNTALADHNRTTRQALADHTRRRWRRNAVFTAQRVRYHHHGHPTNGISNPNRIRTTAKRGEARSGPQAPDTVDRERAHIRPDTKAGPTYTAQDPWDRPSMLLKF